MCQMVRQCGRGCRRGVPWHKSWHTLVLFERLHGEDQGRASCQHEQEQFNRNHFTLLSLGCVSADRMLAPSTRLLGARCAYRSVTVIELWPIHSFTR